MANPLLVRASRICYRLCNMIANKLKEIAEAKMKLAALEASVAAAAKSELAQLPAKFGFASPEAFVEAVRAATSGRDHRSRQSGKQRRRRTTITDEIRHAVKKLAKAGRTNAAIAAELTISVPSVHNIKKALGLVRARK